MRKIKLNTSEKMATTVKLKQPGDNSLRSKNPKQDPGKTQEPRYRDYIDAMMAAIDPNDGIEDAEIINPSNKIDEIIKNNDKFETINVIMKILCKELGIPEDSGSREISEALKGVAERYYKSMEEWRELNKNGQKQDIRQ